MEKPSKIEVGQRWGNYTVSRICKGPCEVCACEHVHYFEGGWDTRLTLDKDPDYPFRGYAPGYGPSTGTKRQRPANNCVTAADVGTRWRFTGAGSKSEFVIKDTTNGAVTCEVLTTDGCYQKGMIKHFGEAIWNIAEPIEDELPDEQPPLAAGQVWRHNDCGAVATIKSVDKDGDGFPVGGLIECKQHGAHGLVFLKKRAPKDPQLSNWSLVSGPKGETVPTFPVASAKVRREVSADGGKTWVDYETMADSDAFDLYPHRRELQGKTFKVWMRAEVPNVANRVIGQYGPVAKLTCQWKSIVGFEQSSGPTVTHCARKVCSQRSPYCEDHVAMVMRERDFKKGRRTILAEPRSKPSPLANRRFLDGAERPWEF